TTVTLTSTSIGLSSVSGSRKQLHSPEEVMDDDVDSLKSFGSVCSTMSCDHAYFARNGTTYSGRRMKYVVHCSPHTDGTEEYLTPTQRANRQIRKLKAITFQMDDLQEREHLDGVSKFGQYGVVISGHFEDIAYIIRVHSKDSLTLPHSPAITQSIAACKDGAAGEDREGERTRIVTMYEKRMEEMQRNHIDECQELKERHNDKVETLLQRLSEVNNRYCELRADYDRAQDKIRELEKDTESLRKSLEEQEDRHKSMYLKMYMKGQEAAKFEHADQVLEFAHRAPSRVSVPELLQQLQVTENELENIKDADQQTDKSKPALLSAKEAISLWILGTRKVC
ncbi:hypothetical protein L9F63_000487, partial [Diploptera punctata]